MTDSDESQAPATDQGAMDQFSAHLDRGWDLVHRGDIHGALLSAEKSLELDAESPEAHNLLGFVRAAQGEHDDALDHYRQAIALDDTFVEAMLNAAEVLIHPLHDFDAAMSMVDDALDWAEGDDEVADALLLKFDAYMHSGDREGAMRVMRSVPEGPFENPRVDFLIGRARFEVGQQDEALPFLDRSLERDPGNAEAHYYRGLSLDAQGKAEEATLAFLRARELEALMPRPHWAPTTEQLERQLQRVLQGLPQELAASLDGALVVVTDTPGAEVVADGVDPRAGLLLDGLGEPSSPPSVRRVFVYQRNVERLCEGPGELGNTLDQLLRQELAAAFPELESAAALDTPPDED